MNTRFKLAYFKRRAGLTLIETMVSLSIAASLMVAVAAAYNASAAAVTANADFFRATQAGRITMNQMLAEIRQCESVSVYSDHIDIIRASANMVTDPTLGTEVYRRFKYDPTNKLITLQIFYGATSTGGTVYEMASNVSGVGFGPAVMGQDWNNTTVVQHVPIAVSVTVGKNFVTLNGAAGPRRAQKSY